MLKVIHTLAIASLLAGCGATQKPVLTPQKTNSEVRFETYPDDTAALEKLVEQQLQQFDNSNDPMLFRQLAINLEKLAKQKPQDREVVFRYYRVGLLAGFVDNYYDMEKWQAYYDQHKFLRYINIAPPVYMEYLLQNEEYDAAPEKLLPILHKTVKASPSFVNGHIKLADHYYNNGQLELAVYLLSNLAKLYPENTEVLANLNWSRLELLQNHMCEANVDKSLQQTFEQSKTLTKLAPNNPHNHILLGSVLREKGSFMLSSFSIKKAANLNADNQTDYLESEFWNTKTQGITSQLTPMDQNQLSTHQRSLLVYSRLVNGQWSELLDIAKLSSRDPQQSLYAILYGAYSAKFLNQDAEFEPILKQGLRLQQANSWQQHMYDYALGQIDEATLLGHSKNRCNESEARFVIGLEHAANGDSERMYKEMKAIVDLDVKSFYEFASARNILKLKVL